MSSATAPPGTAGPPATSQAAERTWADLQQVSWGIFGVPESEVGMFPEEVAGLDAIELGCGTAYVSARLARRGARVVGVDASEAQLATARRLQRQHGLEFPLVLGNAESVPYPDASFDLVISEYGACLWADPHRWVPEAARLLRPGGRLRLPDQRLPADPVHAGTGGPRRHRPAAPARLRPAPPGVARRPRRGVSPVARRVDSAACAPPASRSRTWSSCAPPPTPPPASPSCTLDWARKWPCEEVWKARLQVERCVRRRVVRGRVR